MDWISSFGRRFWQAYTDGLCMTCPTYRCEGEASAADTPAAIDRRQDDVRAVRIEYAAIVRTTH